MRTCLISLLIVAAWPTSTAAQDLTGKCARITAVPQINALGLTCAETASGVALATGPAAAALLPAIDQAGNQFPRHFDTVPAPVAIVAASTITKEQLAAIRTAGFAPLPWFDGKGMRGQLESSIRAKIIEQLPGLTPQQVDSAVAQALTQIPGGSTANGTLGEKEVGALAHEIGHMWFGVLQDGLAQGSTAAAPRYGSSAPDWLDETAAVLMENAAVTQGRRDAIVRGMQMPPLTQFLTMDHPVFDAAKANPGDGVLSDRGGGAGGASIRIVSGAEADKLMAGKASAGPTFYSQARAFADFLIETSGNSRIINEIAVAERSGQGAARWLAVNGKRHHLATSIDRLDRQWQAWLKAWLLRQPG